jgi:uncharacterized repeat protein (TIGR04138 family)
MTQTAAKNITDVVRELGRYSLEAYEFLRQALEYTVEKVHGDTIKSVRSLIEWMESHDASIGDIPNLARGGKLPQCVMKVIHDAGGVEMLAEKLNLHVGGEALCWGVRDLAHERWGLLALPVLNYWGVRTTRDIGEMVFGLIDNGLLQKQPQDTIDDFDQIFDFDTVFNRDYKITPSDSKTTEIAPERE